MPKLNQILAIEKAVKNRNENVFTELYKELCRTELVNGFAKTYTPKNDDGERFPPESKRVQVKAQDHLKKAKAALVELFNITAVKDSTNCVAVGDVVVDGKVLLTGVPATHLLYIEKKLVTILELVKKLPVLDSAEDWHRDEAMGLYRTAPVETMKGKKVVKHLVVVQPTKEHPAQVKETSEDVIIGSWSTVKFSGALPQDTIDTMIERVEKLQSAVKFAREAANSVEAKSLATGDAVLGYIFG